MAARRSTRYTLEYDDPGVTPSALKRLGKRRQLEYVLAWFRGRYEDPAHETPYESAEGGYQWIWGGPYDTREELSEEFSRIASEEVIEQAVEELEADGLSDWAPGPNHPDRRNAHGSWSDQGSQLDDRDEFERAVDLLEAGLNPTYGSSEEKELRARIDADLQQIKLLLQPPTHGGIGHNNPPPDIQDLPEEVVEDIQAAAEVVEAELAKAEPDALEVARAGSRLHRALNYIGKKADLAVDGFVKKVGELSATGLLALGSLTYLEHSTPNLFTILKNTVVNAGLWLMHVISPI